MKVFVAFLAVLTLCAIGSSDMVFYLINSSPARKIAGMHHWKHGRKGFGIYWLQLARDEVRLNRIAQQLFEFIGRSLSDDSFQVFLDYIHKIASLHIK